MKKLIKLTTLFGLAAALSFADNWTGKLVDASCADKGGPAAAAPGGAPKAEPGKASDSCAVSATTTSFAIQTADGKILKLDASGNSKAAAAVKTDAGKAASVSVSGEMQGQNIKVDSIDFK